jgi:Zn-finger nucleic acid-binding protein
MADLTCPKCESPMRSYERSGITVDQCTGCRGVFLDRGELERLVDAEGAYYEAAGSPKRDDDEHRHRDDEHRHRDDDDRRHRERDRDDDDSPFGGLGGLGGFGGGQRGHGKKRKRESFLSDLFD